MSIKHRIFITASLFALLASMLVAGCGGDSSTAQSDNAGTGASPSNSTTTVKKTLSPDGVVMVNGKEFTKADLDKAVNDYKLSLQQDQPSGDGVVSVMIDGQLRDVSTLTTAEYEKMVIPTLVMNEVGRLEIQKMEPTVSEAEINAYIQEQAQKNLPEVSKDDARKGVAEQKLRAEVMKNVPLDASGNPDAGILLDIFDKWYQEAESKYEIIYAEAYKPKSTTTTTSTTPAP